MTILVQWDRIEQERILIPITVMPFGQFLEAHRAVVTLSPPKRDGGQPTRSVENVALDGQGRLLTRASRIARIGLSCEPYPKAIAVQTGIGLWRSLRGSKKKGTFPASCTGSSSAFRKNRRE